MLGKLILLLLVGLGIGLAVPKTRGRIVSPVANRLYVFMVPSRLEMVASQLELQRRRGERLPDQRNLDSWIDRMTNVPPKDPWGNSYYLIVTRDAKGFTLGSMGQDSVRGTEDDMTVTMPVQAPR